MLSTSGLVERGLNIVDIKDSNVFQVLSDFRALIQSGFFVHRLGVTKMKVVFGWSSPRGSAVR
jgi:hypothetical protein